MSVWRASRMISGKWRVIRTTNLGATVRVEVLDAPTCHKMEEAQAQADAANRAS